MTKNKTLIGVIMVVALLALQVGAAAAQATTIDGTVQSVTQSTDGMGNTIFIVTILLADNTTQTVRISSKTAIDNLLVTDNGDGTFTINPVGETVSIDTSLVLPDPCTLPTDANQPVGAALTRFFCGNLGIDYATLQGFHTDGFGYGVIAQACFMAEALGGNALTCSQILQDKKSKDFSNLAKCADSPNWGQLKKCVAVEALNNLGGIMSGQLTPGGTGRTHGQGNGNGHGNSGGNGHGNGPKP